MSDVERELIVKERGNRGGTREQLLDAMHALMIDSETLDVSLSDIADRSGLNSALVKYYFGNKRGLMMALVERNAGQELEKLKGLMSLDLSPSEKLRIHIAGMVNGFARYPYLNRLISVLIRDGSAAEAEEIADRFLRPITDAQADLLREGVSKGAFRATDPKMFYFIATGACDEIFAARHIRKVLFQLEDADPNWRNELIKHVTDILFNGIVAPRKA